MAVNEDTGSLSFVAIEKSSSARSGLLINVPQEIATYQLNLIDADIDKEDIRQAHGALSTAYRALKDKYNRIEAENKELRRRVSKSPSPEMARRGHVVPNDSENVMVKAGPSQTEDSAFELLRHPPEIASIRRSHRSKHGSWQVGDDNNEEKTVYVQFLEKQIAAAEDEKKKLEDQLYELKIRISENNLSSSQMKQEAEEIVSKLKSEVKGLRHRITSLEEENSHLKWQLQDLRKHITTSEAEKNRLQAQIQTLQTVVAQRKGASQVAENKDDFSQHKIRMQDLRQELEAFKEVVKFQKAVIERLLFKVKGKYLVPDQPSPPWNEDIVRSSAFKPHSLPGRGAGKHCMVEMGNPMPDKVEKRHFVRSSSVGISQNRFDMSSSPDQVRLDRETTSSLDYEENQEEQMTARTFAKQRSGFPSTSITRHNSYLTAIVSPEHESDHSDPYSYESGETNVREVFNNRTERLENSNVLRSAGGQPLQLERNETTKTTNQQTPRRVDINLHVGEQEQAFSESALPTEPLALNNHPMACAKPVAVHNLVGTYQADKTFPTNNSRSRGRPVRVCPVCEDNFDDCSQEYFESHVDVCCGNMASRVSQPEETRKCPICSALLPHDQYSDAEYETHVQCHLAGAPHGYTRGEEELMWTCPVCSKKFEKRHTSEEALTNHVNMHFVDQCDTPSVDAATLQYEVVQ